MDYEKEHYNFTWNSMGKSTLTTTALRTGSEKETQFGRKVELNMRIKKLERENF